MTLQLTAEDETLLLVAPLFEGIDRSSVMSLLDSASILRFPESALLFSQGDDANRFFLCLQGRVNLFALTETGDQSIIEVVDKGQSFAEAAMFASMRFPLNAEVVAGTRLLEIPAQPFMRRLAESQGLAAKLLAALAGWQRRMMSEIADLKSRSPVQRLGLFLLALAQSSGTEAGTAVQLPLSKSELASRIGITPESLSRAMARLRPLGVSTQGRSFVLEDPAALRRFCGED